MLYKFQAVSPPIIRSSKTVHTAPGKCQACLLLPLAVGASKLDIYPMLCVQFLSSWWWAKKPPETCTALTVIKNIVWRCILLVILKKCRDLTWQRTTLTTDIHAVGGIRTRNPSKRTATDPRLRSRGHWNRHIQIDTAINPLNTELNPICHLLALLGGATIVVVSRLRVKSRFVMCWCCRTEMWVRRRTILPLTVTVLLAVLKSTVLLSKSYR